MDRVESIDHARLGIDAQYSPAQCHKIRRLILEDWKKAGVKLPTYMKLVARYIAGHGVPEAWLSKLSHQTIDKMLKGVSTPRYEVWACLHLYLTRKYGEPGISAATATDAALLGRALARFAGLERTDAESDIAGRYTVSTETLSSGTGLALAIHRQEGEAFHTLRIVRRFCTAAPFADEVAIPYQGVGTIRAGKMTAVLREIATRSLETMDLDLSTLAPLEDDSLSARLAALEGAP